MASHEGPPNVAYALEQEEWARMDAAPLVRTAQDGDVRAFETLLQDRLSTLLRLALAILGDEVDARDAVQQACVQAWRELPRLREADRFDAWLHRILVNECRASLRGRRRRRVREIAVSHLQPDQPDFGVSPVPGPADRTEQLEILERAFNRLDVGARTILALHYLEDWSVADISAELRLPSTTVKWRLHRARTALAQALELERR
jgi:RNA polymerase sigma-70 factor (ECF subfamily)